MDTNARDAADHSDTIRKWEEVRNNADRWPEEWERANRHAFLALGGMYSDVVGIIVHLLRSDMPLHPAFRHVLADALEGEGPEGTAKFKMHGVPHHGRYSPKTQETSRQHVEIGEFIEGQISSGISRTKAEEAAVKKFPVGKDTANKITDGYRRMMEWADDMERHRGEHHLVMAETFEALERPDIAEQARARAEKQVPPMTPEQRRTLCLSTYREPLVKAKATKARAPEAKAT